MRSAWQQFIFSVFSVSVAATKALRFYVNVHAFSPTTFALLPAFILPDVFVLCIAHAMLRRGRWVLYWFRHLALLPVIIVTFGAATAELTFYWTTGGELRWGDTAAFVLHDESRKILLSGLPTAGSVAGMIVLSSIAVQKTIYKVMCAFMAFAALQWLSVLICVRKSFRYQSKHELNFKVPWNYITDRGATSHAILPVFTRGREPAVTTTPFNRPRLGARRTSTTVSRLFLCIFSVALLELALITSMFGSGGPYTQVLETLPLSLVQAFHNNGDHYCPTEPRSFRGNFPTSVRIPPDGGQASSDKKPWIFQKYGGKSPSWLSAPMPPGFDRWDNHMNQSNGSFAGLASSTLEIQGPSMAGPKYSKPKCSHSRSKHAYYDPMNDALKISNLDTDILEPLRRPVTNGSATVRNIVLIQMESLRQELFPLQSGSDFHRLITATHDTPDLSSVNGQLAYLTPNSEIITGKRGGFVSGNDDHLYSSSEWNSTTAHTFGGLTIVGAHTTSSVSFKSTAAIHCGLWPMAVDMFEEADRTNYQPCLPQILGLFNGLKETIGEGDWRNYQWNSAFFQSITDEYDRQARFNAKIGFSHVVTKTKIKEDSQDPGGPEEINYFGYAETVLKPYIKDFVINSTKNNQRMFLSHFTSTTHHPWGTPSGFDIVEYMGRGHGLTNSHQDMNKYLNAVRWHDAWLGELMQLFDDLGISEETLMVFVGDHGQAFQEDCSKSGTYENSHISNFRVPIVFRHPKLPRVELNIHATSISILPTILDLLISTGSLNEKDMTAAEDLIQEYEGQSLIRPYKSNSSGKRAWNFGVVNPGGRMLVVTSADAPWRLVIPLRSEGDYMLTNLEDDPLEASPLKHWSLDRLLAGVRRNLGGSAADWVIEANTVALWWVEERQRLWTAVPDAAP